MTTPEQFEAACRKHDLTYHAADDYSSWKRGNESLQAIILMADELGIEVAAPIWNRIVDLKLEPRARAEYHWSMPKQEAA